MNETANKEDKKKKRKVNYMLMLFVDSKEGRIRQMGIGPTVVEATALSWRQSFWLWRLCVLSEGCETIPWKMS